MSGRLVKVNRYIQGIGIKKNAKASSRNNKVNECMSTSICVQVFCFCCVSVGLGKLLVQFGLAKRKEPIIKRSLTDGFIFGGAS